MPFSLESLAAVATIVGAAVSVLALLQSSAWLGLSSFLAVCLAVGIGLYAHRQRSRLNSASVIIEGHSIDSLNIANLRRRVSRTFFIQEAQHTIRIENEDLHIEWKYSGFCKKDGVSSMEFSIDSEEGTPLSALDCAAFDLGRDPEMKHRISPVLIGAEGISKKVVVTFLESLRANQSFGLLLRCTLPRSIPAGFGYYTSTVSFAQACIPHSTVRLIFTGSAPHWLRVYESSAKRGTRLVKTLAPTIQEPGLCEYVDVVDGRPGQSARVYAFWRDTPEGT